MKAQDIMVNGAPSQKLLALLAYATARHPDTYRIHPYYGNTWDFFRDGMMSGRVGIRARIMNGRRGYEVYTTTVSDVSYRNNINVGVGMYYPSLDLLIAYTGYRRDVNKIIIYKGNLYKVKTNGMMDILKAIMLQKVSDDSPFTIDLFFSKIPSKPLPKELLW